MTKRQLGFLFIALGVTAVLGLFALDIVRAGQHQGIGPAQKQARVAAGLAVLVGLTLLPLGNRPA
ncbi:MAG: hypothetical protein HS099_08515 [Ardenticatenaceae bacterium]|nr:hypothetical protein [Ardenticatenaceae bacterium]